MLRGKSNLVVVVAYPLFAVSALFGASITLQQGVDSYGGCADSYIADDGADADTESNFGDNPDITVAAKNYAA